MRRSYSKFNELLLVDFYISSNLYTYHISNISPIHLQYISNSSPIIEIGVVLEKNWSKTEKKLERSLN